MAMGEMMHRTMCLMVLMLCCAYGCVLANQSDNQQPPQHAAVPGSPGFVAPLDNEGSHAGNVAPVNRSRCLADGTKAGSGVNTPPCVPDHNETSSPKLPSLTTKGTPRRTSDTLEEDGRVEKVDQTAEVIAAHPFPGTTLKPDTNATLNPDVPGTYGVVNGGPGTPKNAGAPGGPHKPYPDPVFRTTTNYDPKAPCNTSDVSCLVGVPGAVPIHKDGRTASTHGVHGINKEDRFARSHLLTQREANLSTVGAPTVARNRDSLPPPTTVDSQNHEQQSGSTNIHHEENNNQAENIEAPAQSAPTRNTPNTPTKVTSPAMPTILQPPTPAKSETKPPKKRKADSSSIGSVWVRVPLLIVVVLFSVTVY
ncbi:uncharacterized protein TM35_000102920 [Trypanosoma theileri]|uniref:Mucin TcMUCII n=1 Tax=Trypanosoma theileri TaxID=67003 RepID=A0A1X0NZA7_9TRYP|nr:uncharacterized protein TM35_000102920 [Trypanosoma theileri]ORC90024.1 hypothetical protein TM35_000102920 [Trypanosoma theileri]